MFMKLTLQRKLKPHSSGYFLFQKGRRDFLNYNIVYADPPRRYRQRKGQGVVEKHYPTMELEDICNLTISSITDRDCSLFLWETFHVSNYLQDSP